MSKKKCNKCAVLCIHCKNMYKDDGDMYCHEFFDTEHSCVDDTDCHIHHKCIEHNKDGNCKKYVEDKSILYKEKLLNILNKNNYSYDYMSCYYIHDDIALALINDLKRVLGGGSSHYLKKYWDDSDSYDPEWGIIPTKSFLEKGRNHRKEYK